MYAIQFEGSGSVQSGWRPGVIFQNNTGNLHSPNVLALPMTSNLRRVDIPTHVLLRASDSGLLRDSVVLCENPYCLPKEHLGRYITTLSSSYMKQIATAYLLATSAISFIDQDTLVEIWKQSMILNSM